MKKYLILLIFPLLILCSSCNLYNINSNNDLDYFNVEKIRNFINKTATDKNYRVGIYIKDINSGKEININQNDQFLFFSTVKAFITANIFHDVDQKLLNIDKRIRISAEEIVTYSPCLETRVNSDIKISELVECVVVKSDNTASNILLKLLGGPSKLNNFFTKQKILKTNINDYEPKVNFLNPKNILLNTTNPKQYGLGFQHILLNNDYLTYDSRQQLISLLKKNETSNSKSGRIKSISGWENVNKTGSSDTGTNDLGILYYNNIPKILFSIFVHTKDLDNFNVEVANNFIGDIIVKLVS